jgi:alpha-1,3-mannosyltransferase
MKKIFLVCSSYEECEGINDRFSRFSSSAAVSAASPVKKVERREREREMFDLRKMMKDLVRDWKYFWWIVGVPILIGETVFGVAIVNRVAYTKIDWDAYMEEVEGPMERGEFNYANLRGETGPLVYPAGFVWIYGLLRWIAGGDGSDVRAAQYVFLGFYVLTSAVVLSIYKKIGKGFLPVGVCILLCVSKRIHSLFMLRMFNDCVAMLFLYFSLMIFTMKQKWRWPLGCVYYSLAVSIKMNIFLFAPALWLLMLIDIGLVGSLACISLCAIVQLVVGAPFIFHDIISYLAGAFRGFGDLNHKWSVNWKFISTEVFMDKRFAILLLVLHLGVLILFAHYRWCHELRGLGGLKRLVQNTLTRKKKFTISPRFIVRTMLECNFIGVVFSRSLHFQFYSWYWHALPILLWSANLLPVWTKLILLLMFEYAWSYGLDKVEGTSTVLSSLVLQIAHLVLLLSLWFSDPFPIYSKGGMGDGRGSGVTTSIKQKIK